MVGFFLVTVNESEVAQFVDMMGDRRFANVETLREILATFFPFRGNFPKDFVPGFVAERFRDSNNFLLVE
jgi:hypothetical protein